MLRSAAHLRLLTVIAALASALMFAPRLRLPHVTPQLKPVHQASLNGLRSLADVGGDDGMIVGDRADVVSAFEPVVPPLVVVTVRSRILSRAAAPEEAGFFWPLRRLSPRADSEDPLAS